MHTSPDYHPNSVTVDVKPLFLHGLSLYFLCRAITPEKWPRGWCSLSTSALKVSLLMGSSGGGRARGVYV